MEENIEQIKQTKQLFSNYLRELYVEPTAEELAWIKTRYKSITDNSWCAIISDPRLVKGLLSYFLVAQGCPDYAYINTVDLVEERFKEERTIQEFVEHPGIVIIRHSNMSIRNKLMLETLMYIISERAYKNKRTIIISNTVKDEGEYLYYEHSKITKLIPCDISCKLPGGSGTNKPLAKTVSTPSHKSSSINPRTSSRPLANIMAENASVTKERKLKDRAAAIEESAKDAI